MTDGPPPADVRGRPEAALAAIVDDIDELVCLLTHDLVVRYANEAVGRAFGRDVGELVDRRLDELLPPPSAELLRQAALNCQRTDSAVSVELLTNQNQRDVRVSARVAPFRGPSALETIELVVTGRDITETKRLAEELRQTRAEVDGLFRAHPDLSFQVSADGTFLHFHAARTSDLYAPPETFLGKTIREVLPPDVAKLCEQEIARVLSGETSVGHIEYSLSMPSGEKYYEASVAALSDEQVLFLARDISDRMKLEQAGVAAGERLRVALSAAEMGIWEWDILENVITWSDTALAMYGVTRDRFDGTYEEFLDMVHPEDRGALDAAVRAALSAPPPRSRYEHAYRHIRADGTVRWHHATGSVLHHDGEPRLMLGAVRDVTDRRRLEDRLLQSQKLEAVGRLAGGIAHDFNNMLTAIMSGASLVQLQLADPDKARAHLADVQAAAQKSAELTRQLLTFARMQVVEPRRVDLNELIRNTTRMLRRLIGEHISVETSLADDLSPLFLDPSQMEQVLMNLVVNARDSMSRGGTVFITTENQRFEAARDDLAPGEYVRLTVEDTGSGIDEETRSHIFEPFFTTKERGKGTGLGLATAYGIAKQAGGDIVVTSQPGDGARFDVFLPACRGAVHAAASRVEGDAPLGTEHVLVVEDEGLVLNMIRTILTSSGYKVTCASSPASALALTQQDNAHVQLLLTDIVMPNMSGRELARRVREEHPEVRVLYMSGYAAGDANQDAPESLDAPFLQKPFSPDRLLRSVRDAINAKPGG